MANISNYIKSNLQLIFYNFRRKDLASTRKNQTRVFSGWFGVIDEYCSGFAQSFFATTV